MGLDTTHDCWHGACSAFSRWRNALAEAAGYWVDRLPNGHITAIIDWGHITDANLYGDWDTVPADPLLILIAHSDCDGVIRSEHCGLLADRLEDLLPKLPEGSGGGHIGDWRSKTRQFVDGLRLAASRRENVGFG